MVRAIVRAYEWRGWLEQGEAQSYRDIATKAGLDTSYVQVVLLRAFLDPPLTRELLDGRLRLGGGVMELLRRGIPIIWEQQWALFRTQAA